MNPELWHVTYLLSRHSVLLQFVLFHEVTLVLNEWLDPSTWHVNIHSILHLCAITECNQALGLLQDRRSQLTARQTPALTAPTLGRGQYGTVLEWDGEGSFSMAAVPASPLSRSPFPPLFFCLSRCLPIGRDTGRPLFICPPRALQPFRGQTEKTVRVCLRWSHRAREGKGRCRGEGVWVQRGREAKWLRSCCRHAAPCDRTPLQSDGGKERWRGLGSASPGLK